jgi:ABC-type glycerol-3-phosphate transport system substrate-binding protein
MNTNTNIGWRIRLQHILVFILVAALLAACGGAGQEPTVQATTAPDVAEPPAEEQPVDEGQEPAGEAGAATEISLWTEFTAGGEATGITELVDTFNAKGTGITVNHRPIGNEEFFTVVRTGLAGGEPPDVLQWEGYQQTRDFAAAGQIMDLTEWWTANKDRFALQEAGEYSCTYEGKVYCIPYTFLTGWQIYYNPEILTANGIEVPTTMEEFLEAAQTLKDAGITPIALGNKDGWPGEHWWMAFLVQRCGVDTVYQAIRGEGAQFTDQCFVQASEDLQNLSEQGFLSPGAVSDDYGTAQAVFLSGQAAFFQTGSWFASGWEQDPPPFEVGIMEFPRWSGTEHSGDVIGAVTHTFGIPANAKNKEGAMQFLEFLASDEGAQIWAKNGNSVMIAGAVEQAAPQVIKDIWAKVQTAEDSLPWIENELPPGVGEDKVYNGTVALIGGRMTPEEFVQSIQEGLATTTE